MSDYAIETSGLVKQFGKGNIAVNELDMTVDKGSVYGLIGRNGAGKTTTMRILAGVMRATRGAAKILGHEMHQASAENRARFAYVSQMQEIHKAMTLSELCEYIRNFYPKWDQDYAKKLTKQFELQEDRSVGLFSGGQLRKVALILAFAARPEVLLLDEPAAGLDPVARRELVDAIIEGIHHSDVSTVFFSTHIITDLERVADTVGIMDKGKLLMQDKIENLQSDIKRVQVIFGESGPPDGFEIPGAIRSESMGSVINAIVQIKSADQLDSVKSIEGVRVQEFALGLEEIFIEMFGKGDEK